MRFNKYTLIFILLFLLCGLFKNIIIILFIVITHEMAHVLVAKLLGYKIISVEIYPFGGITKIDKPLNDHILSDLLIARAGILLQLIYFLLFKIGLWHEQLFYEYNLAIMLFNMLPIIPLDGAKVIFELLNYFFSYQKSLYFDVFISFVATFFYTLLHREYNLNNYFMITFFIYKTWTMYQDRHLIYSKFILERKLYNIKYRKIKTKNVPKTKMQKDVKYYYWVKGKIIDEKNII